MSLKTFITALALGASCLSQANTAVSCRTNTDLSDKNSAKKTFPFKGIRTDFKAELKGDRIEEAKGTYPIADTEYWVEWNLSYFPEGVTPIYSAFTIQAQVVRIEKSGRKTLVHMGDSLGFHGNTEDPKSPIFNYVSWDNPGFINAIIDAGFTFDQAMLIPVAGNDQMWTLLQDGRAPDHAVLNHTLTCQMQQ